MAVRNSGPKPFFAVQRMAMKPVLLRARNSRPAIPARSGTFGPAIAAGWRGALRPGARRREEPYAIALVFGGGVSVLR